jgi:hypothetical protein
LCSPHSGKPAGSFALDKRFQRFAYHGRFLGNAGKLLRLGK